MKKMIALALAGAMVFSTPVMAKEVGAPVAVYLKDGSNIGVPEETVLAINEDKLISEHMNNAVTGIWAMDKVLLIAQGGGIVVDGVPTNITMSVEKPYLSHVYAAKEYAATLGGSVMTVIKADAPTCMYGTANVNFYAPGVTAGQKIKVCQYAGGVWNELNVTEIREDHIVVDMTANGTLAFIAVP